VVEVGGTVEEFDLADRLNGGGDAVYHFGPPRFGEVGDAFDELGHGVSWSLSQMIVFGRARAIINGAREKQEIGIREILLYTGT
jgi:hypothetical protein